MTQGESPLTLEKVREIQRRAKEMEAEEAARLRYMIDRAKSLENGGSAIKRRRRRHSGGLLPGGALSPEQIDEIVHYRQIGMSYGEISFLMRISKSSAHKYGKDFQSLW